MSHKYHKLPEHLLYSLHNYIKFGEIPGSFLRAVLSNDLVEAVSRADEINSSLLAEWVKYIYNYAPMGCWGSEDAVNQWICKGGNTRKRDEEY